MKRIVVPFKDLKTKHKVFITIVGFFIHIVGMLTFLIYTTAHPENELIAGFVVFIPTFSLITVSMLLMTIRFQKYYASRQQEG
jgi:hypothetical protein